jgi:co-chaperonin GroES (HSP10)
MFGKWMAPSKLVPWCKVGDWVVFDRNAGPQINYRGVPVTIIEDKNIRAVVECPTYVSRY